MMIVVLVFCYCTTNVHRRKEGKYIGLNRGYKQLNHIDKGDHDCRQHSNRVGFKDEYQGDKRKDYDVTRCDRHQ